MHKYIGDCEREVVRYIVIIKMLKEQGSADIPTIRVTAGLAILIAS